MAYRLGKFWDIAEVFFASKTQKTEILGLKFSYFHIWTLEFFESFGSLSLLILLSLMCLFGLLRVLGLMGILKDLLP